MLVALAIVAALLLLNKGKSSATKTPTPGGDGGGGPNLSQLGAAGAAIVPAAVAALKAAGLVGGGGTAAASTTGATVSSTAGTGGGSTGVVAGTAGGLAGVESFTTVEGFGAVGSTLGAGASLAVGGVILAVEVLIAVATYFIIKLTDSTAHWRFVFERPIDTRYLEQLCANEVTVVTGVVDPETSPPTMNPKTGLPYPSRLKQGPGARTYIKWLSTNDGAQLGAYVPTGLDMSAAETLALWRLARWCALRRLEGQNAGNFNFWENVKGPGAAMAENVALSPDNLTEWLRRTFTFDPGPYDGPLPAPSPDGGTDPEATGGLGLSLFSSFDDLDAQARAQLGAGYSYVLNSFRFTGSADAISFCGQIGYGPFWPGDEEFTRQVVRYCGLGNGSNFANANGGWFVDLFTVGGTLRWVAVDPASLWGVDVVSAHQTGQAKVFPPGQLGFTEGSTLLTLGKSFTKPTVTTLAPVKMPTAKLSSQTVLAKR